ncbi:MAG: DUF6062 family protein [Clostridiaceae bacterium]
MKEKIYTIPVTEAFGQDCECPVCLLEKKLEDDNIDYNLGAALMEPDCRIETNKKGFCRRHFEMLYNKQENRLGLGLVTDTHMRQHLLELEELSKAANDAVKSSKPSNPLFGALSGKFSLKGQNSDEPAKMLIELLTCMERSCTVCDKLERTMDRYMDVIMYLWSREEDFRQLFADRKGFCLVHLKQLAQASVKYLSPRERALFINMLLQQQVENMDRIEKELDWFTKKFDYRNNEASWGNSKDALPRSIQKLKGYLSLK